MLVTNDLPTIRAPNDVPSEELFGSRAEFQIQKNKPRKKTELERNMKWKKKKTNK